MIVDIGLSELVPISQTGQGIYRLVTILADIIGEKPDVVLIDEIENGLHHVRDVTLKEDACRSRKGDAAQALAALRNAAVHLLEGVEAESKAAATRHLAGHPKEALALFLGA